MAGRRSKAAFDRPEIVLTLAMAMAKEGNAKAVRELLAEATADHSGEALYQQIARYVLARAIPPYHGAMLADDMRNLAYRKAIEATVKGKQVLDIGTGSGLLAMMAARAGAARVVACEMNEALAETARRIIAANGLADRIEVHACHSSKLDRASICPQGFDVVISEIFSANLLGEGVLYSLEQARRDLCAPGAIFVPERAEIRVALASFPQTSPDLGAIEGFNLSEFAAHLPLVEPVAHNHPRLALASEAATLANFTFAQEDSAAATGRKQVDVRANGSRANGIAQWLRVDFGFDAVYENGPGCSDDAHWSILGYPLAQPCHPQAGETVKIEAFHHDDALVIWSDVA